VENDRPVPIVQGGRTKVHASFGSAALQNLYPRLDEREGRVNQLFMACSPPSPWPADYRFRIPNAKSSLAWVTLTRFCALSAHS